MPPKSPTTRGKKGAAAAAKASSTRASKGEEEKKASGGKDVSVLTKTVNDLKAKVFLIDEKAAEKKTRLRVIDAIDLDNEAELQKAEFAAETEAYETEKGLLDEEDPTFQGRVARLERRYARSKNAHEASLEKLFANMAIERQSLEEEQTTLNKEVENLRRLRKTTVAQLEKAKAELEAAQSA